MLSLRRPLLFAVSLAVLPACVDADAPRDPADTTSVVFEVPKGASARGLSDELVAADLVSAEWQWQWFVRNADAGCIKAGPHEVSRSMSMNELLAALCAAPIPDDIPFTVLEGWRIRDIDRALADKGLIAPGAYAAIASSKGVDAPFDVTGPSFEGYLYPETYQVPPDKERFDVAAFVRRQLDTFQARFLDPHQGELGDRSLHDVVVVASMIEREEPTPRYRPIVAGIIWKRLDSGTALGIDATSRYQLENWEDEKAFRAVLKDPADPYGTRVRVGLPPTAIGNPTLSSLEAALKPEPTAFWYYLHDSSGVFHGGRNAAEHEANRKKYNVY